MMAVLLSVPNWASDQPAASPPPANRHVDAIYPHRSTPRLAARSDAIQRGAVMTAKVMIGAVLILLMIMLLSALALEATACSVGVPNCD